MDLREAAEFLVECGKRTGASDTEVVAAGEERLEVEVRLGEAERVRRARERRVAVRMFVGTASSVGSTADVSAEALEALARRCFALARAATPDPFAGLPEVPSENDRSVDLDLFDPRALEFPIESALALARACERAALEADPRIRNSDGAELSCSAQRTLYATSRGVFLEHRSSRFDLSVCAIAAADGSMRRDSWFSAARHLRDLDPPERVGRIAAMRALRRLGARPLGTTEVPVIFEPPVAATLLGHIAGAVSGTSVCRGLSFLADRLDTAIAAPIVTIEDDPRIPRGLGSRLFDAEGLPTRRNVVVDSGVLRTYLLDSYSARRLGRTSTASAVRSLGDVPAAGTSNWLLRPGSCRPEDIVRATRRGFYVTEVFGFGVNPVTGDYSRGASGLWIENGEFAFPVEGVTIAGNLLRMLLDVEVVGNDLELRSATACPTLRIAAMTVAGEGPPPP